MRPIDRLTGGLVYKDLAGRRRVRRYVLAATAIFILIGGIAYRGWRQQRQSMALGVGMPTAANTVSQQEVKGATPASAEVALAVTQPASMPAQPTVTPSVATQPPTPEVCPDDPEAWELPGIAQNDNFKRIEPSCVYNGLARTVAWDLLRVMGYSAAEAAEMMGFANFPWRPMPEIMGMTNTQGPMPIALANPSPEEIRQASHPEFHAWITDSEGNPGATLTLRGCYRTETIQSDQVERWGVKYPVVCVVSMDQEAWVVMELGAHRYATRSLPTRRFFIYGYAGNGLWVSIGYQEEPFVEIRLPESVDPALLPLTMDLKQIMQDREFIAGLHGLVPWDAAWLEQTFSLTVRPLPANWQSLNKLAEYQAIRDEKEQWAKERFP